MNTRQIRSISMRLGTCVGLTCDPAADTAERWVASIGLGAMGAGKTPGAAMRAALADLPEHEARPETSPGIRRGRLVLRTAPK